MNTSKMSSLDLAEYYSGWLKVMGLGKPDVGIDSPEVLELPFAYPDARLGRGQYITNVFKERVLGMAGNVKNFNTE